jgi:predicted lipid-binding transport protein (Tim44 family)
MILLLGGLAVVGAMMLLRRRPQPASPYVPAGVPAGMAPQADRKVYRVGEGMSFNTAPASSMTRLPDGTETAAFLRQVRASFMHIQSLNSPEQVEEVRRYLTPELFESLKAEIAANRELAEFPELNVDLLDAVVEGDKTVASVRFTGKVSESLHAPATPFAEIWHFVRPVSGDPRWVLAGIQQE